MTLYTHGPYTDNLILYLDPKREDSFNPGTQEKVWQDISGNGYDAYGEPNSEGSGTDDSQFPIWEANNGGRFSFDGSHGLTIPSDMGNPNELSIETWMYFRGTDNNYLSDARNGNGAYNFPNYSGYNINVASDLQANDPAGGDWAGGGTTSQANSNWWEQWTHFVMASDSSQSYLYVNGEQITDDRINTNSPFSRNLGQYFRIGSRYTSANRLKGELGSFRLYNTVLNETQARVNYNAEKMYYRNE